MHKYQIGALYHPDRTHWQEFTEYNYRNRAHELRLFIAEPSQEEIDAIASGQCLFGLYANRDVIFFGFRFMPLDWWGNCPYSIHLVPEADRQLPSPMTSDKDRVVLTVFLVSAEDGIVRGLRTVSFSPAFSRAMNEAIWTQFRRPFPGDAEYDRQIQAIYGRYDNQKIYDKLATARCRGGEEDAYWNPSILADA